MWEFILLTLAGLSVSAVGILGFDLAFGDPITPFLVVVYSGEMARWPTVLQQPCPDHHSQVETSEYHGVPWEDDTWL